MASNLVYSNTFLKLCVIALPFLIFFFILKTFYNELSIKICIWNRKYSMEYMRNISITSPLPLMDAMLIEIRIHCMGMIHIIVDQIFIE